MAFTESNLLEMQMQVVPGSWVDEYFPATYQPAHVQVSLIDFKLLLG